MKDYHNLYLKYDILLLTDVFEKARNSSLKDFWLCPSHSFSALVFCCDAFLTMKKVQIDLISDKDMYLFFDKGMRGSVFYISDRYSRTKKKYFKAYGPKKESKHTIYLEANDLYGYAMSEILPTNRFKWIDPKEFEFNKPATIVQNVVFYKFILNFLKNHMNCSMIIVQPQIKWKSKKKCCLIIN